MVVTVESVTAALREAARQAVAGEFAPAVAALDELARPERLTGLIDRVLDDPSQSTQCAPLSFFHVLGFEKFVLLTDQSDFMLRMHVWRPGADRPLGDIHNHRSAVVSVVIHGSLEKQVFVRDPTAAGHMEYEEECNESGWTLHRVGPAGLRQAQLTSLERGGRYALAPDVLHRIKVDRDRLTVTLFMETRPTRRTTAVFTNGADNAPGRLPKEPLTPAGYRQGLQAALVALSAAATAPA
jgi:hypothetical protein